MASIVFSQIGSNVGSALGGAMGGAIGSTLGSLVGHHLDNRIFPKAAHYTHGARLGDLLVQTSCYGKVIADIYGVCAIAGNVIWSAPLKERAQKSGNHTNYNYSITCAIALCKGPIDGILRIWVDSKLVDINFAKYRVYNGSQEQMPDHLIEAIEGVGKTPAFRGLAYIVLEDFPLEEYHNRLPNFVFEVKRKIHNEDNLENMITNMVIIPGSGEFVYDTTIIRKLYGMPMPNGRWVQRGMSVLINNNNYHNKADALVGLDQLQEDCPKLKWAAPVVSWYVSSLDAGATCVLPGVEYQNGAITSPDIWSVAGFSRDAAHLISKNKAGEPLYGGSVNDLSVIRYLTELRRRGLKIMLNPMIFVDVKGKPWRGRITGDAAGVREFFNGANGYNNFIMHYANLARGRVDAFIIGSELVGLTKIRDEAGDFVVVKELVRLASKVREVLGVGVKITYAADWSEYHHTDGGWYHLDELWASPDIDMVGIDAYFPLTETSDIASEREIIDGWEAGEGYDFYYEDGQRKSLSLAYAWKNIGWWWGNEHIQPGGSKSAWVPKSKPIWFTEFGFPSVDACANQPNVFYDEGSVESFFPKYSKGLVDFAAQRTAIKASIKKWQNSEFVQEMFLYCYDARPYPFWPSMKLVWRDAGMWAYGHWLNGKLGDASLRGIVSDLCKRAGLKPDQYDCSMLNDNVEGFIIANHGNARLALEVLSTAYFFKAMESDGKLKFIPIGSQDSGLVIDEDELVDVGGDYYQIEKEAPQELPSKTQISFIDKVNNYSISIENANMAHGHGKKESHLSLPLVLSGNRAQNIAQKILLNIRNNVLSFNFALSTNYSFLEPGDLVTLKIDGVWHRIMINEICCGGDVNILKIKASSYKSCIVGDRSYESPNVTGVNNDTQQVVHLLELPHSANHSVFLAITSNARSTAIYDDGGRVIANAKGSAVIGEVIDVLEGGFAGVMDHHSVIDVMLIGGELESCDNLNNEKNLALIGKEVIQFTNAKLIQDHHYRLSGLIRGCFGTEIYMDDHSLGERFLLIDRNLIEIPVKLAETVSYKIGDEEVTHTYLGSNLKPRGVCDIKVSKNENGDLLISWNRKSRINHNNWDYEVPLLESLEKYEVDILKNNLIIRSVYNNEPFLTYNRDQIYLDFNNNLDNFAFIVYQKSDLVGRGVGTKYIYREQK